MKLTRIVHIHRPIRTALAVLAVAAVPAGAVAVPAAAGGDRHPGKVSLVSVAATGGGGNGRSGHGGSSGVSAHGRYVLFSSAATDLVARRHQRPGRRLRPRHRDEPYDARLGRREWCPGQRREPARIDLGRRPVRRVRLARLEPVPRRHQQLLRRLPARSADRTHHLGLGRPQRPGRPRRVLPGHLGRRPPRGVRVATRRTSCPATPTTPRTSSSGTSTPGVPNWSP